MKKSNFKQACIVLLLIVVAFSIAIIFFKHVHLTKKTEEITENIKNNIKEIDDFQEAIVFEDGSIGILKIPSLEIEAPIREGTGQEILKYTIRAF